MNAFKLAKVFLMICQSGKNSPNLVTLLATLPKVGRRRMVDIDPPSKRVPKSTV